jgi:Ca2+-transporting ATPase
MAVVFATGMDTQLGRIAAAVQSIEVQKTPFEQRMRHTGKILSGMMLAVVGLVSIVGLARGHAALEMLIWGVSLAVAAVPEALPAVVATSLTLGVYQMARKNAIVRRLPAVESLGSTTVICCDKTGTLTKGEMTVRQVYIYDTVAGVTGSGYSPDGAIAGGIEKGDLDLLASCAALCNDVTVRMENGRAVVTGDPTEAALAVLAAKAGVDKKEISSTYPRVYEVPFTSERKRMTTVHRTGDGHRAYMKGAVEVVLARCSHVRVNGKQERFDQEMVAKVLAANNAMASEGLRVLAFAYKELGSQDFAEKVVETDLTFIGLAAMMDPPRPETAGAVDQCKEAGINVVMITGDHQLTASSVAKEVGIAAGEAMTGAELDRTDVESLAGRADKIDVYSRVSPEHKLKIVQALKSRGHIVAMTGDGTNDAPALKAADIGVAMGITGTQVAKESSSMILADDNFATIVMAVREGRRIIDNVKKYLVYLLSANISEIILLTFSIAMGWPFPLLAKHLLYINLATDGSPAIALGMEPAEPGVMKRRPRSPKESIFYGTRWLMVGIPVILSTISIVLFWSAMEQGGWESGPALDRARTMVFGLVVFFELFFAFSSRSFRQSVTRVGLLRNRMMAYSLAGESAAVLFIMNHPFMQGLFGLAPLAAIDWAVILSLATAGFLYCELAKLVKKKA